MTCESAIKNYYRNLDAGHEEGIGTTWPSYSKQLKNLTKYIMSGYKMLGSRQHRTVIPGRRAFCLKALSE